MFIRHRSYDKFCCAEGDGGGAAGPGGGGGNPPPDFLAMLPDDIRGDVGFKDFAKAASPAEAVGNLARSYINQGKLLGAPRDQLLQLPLASDDAKAWEPVWNRLGRPEAADKYQLTDPDPKTLPAGFELSAEGKSEFQKIAHELGLSQKQADAWYQRLNADRLARFTAMTDGLRQGIAAADATLNPEQRADMNSAIAHFATQFKLGDGLQKAVDNTPGDTGVAIRQVFAELGRQMKADGKLLGGGGQGESGKTVADALAERQALFGNAEFMKQYSNPNRAIRQPAIDRMMALNEIIAAGRQPAA